MSFSRLAVFAAMVAAAPSAATSERPSDHATFYIISGTDTVVAERATRSATSLVGEFADRARGGRIVYTAALTPNGLVSRLTTRVFQSSRDTVGSGASFLIDGDSIIARMGDAAPAHVPSMAGALPLVNPSIAFIEQLIRRARAVDRDEPVIPIFIIGTPRPMTAKVTWVGADSAVLEYAGAVMRLAVSAEGSVLGGVVPAANVRIARSAATDRSLDVERDAATSVSASTASEDVVIRTRAGLQLSGTLTTPTVRAGVRVPAVVTVTGSGPEDRDGESASLRGYRPFRELADSLGRRGIAVLRLDDRGVNGSDAGPSSATSRDFADDIRAAVAYLRTRRDIDATRIGLVGHREGATIATMVAHTDGQLRGIVLLAGAASTGRDILLSQQHYVVDTVMKLTGAARSSALAARRRTTDSLAKVTPWLASFLAFEPATLARQVETPVLILHGEADHQVPSPEAERLARAFRTSGNRSVTVRLFPATNHLFVADTTGGFDDAKLPSLRVRPAVLGAIGDWLAERFQ